jgi:hypothetical protein
MGDELWDSLRFLLAGAGQPPREFTSDEKIDLLARLVVNLIDEVEILRDFQILS